MSGDVQPRKRRDKKKKKDEFEETIPHQFQPRAPTPPGNSDEVIHVYKESHTGGGICAKLVFFVLLSILAVLIGLIITEHRGLTDLDTIEAESKFSQIFEGWVDKTPDDHDDHGHAAHFHGHDDEHDDHDDAHDDHHEEEEDDHDDHDDDHDEDHEDDEHASEEDEHASEEEEEALASEEEAEESAADDEGSPSIQDDEEEEEEDDDEQESAQQDEDDDDDEENDVAESEQEDEEDAQSEPASTEAADASNADDDDEDSAPKDGDDDDDDDVEKDEPSAEQASEENDDKSTETPADKEDDGDDGDDDDENEAGDDDEDEPVVEVEEDDQENTAVGVKIGVGVAIVVVAYVVLVRKWKSDKIEKTEPKSVPLDLSRRNTIVVPPRVEEVVDQVVDDDEGCSEDELEDEIILNPIIKEDYKKLRTTYQRSLTPDSEPENPEDNSEEDEEEGDVNIEYDDEDVEDEEDIEDEEEVEVEVEEEEEEGEEREEEEEESDEPDDEELMQKLEAKYGKLSAKDVEDAEEGDSEQEEEEEEEHENQQPWKRIKPSGAQAVDSDDENQGWVIDTPVDTYENITNEQDGIHKQQLDEAQEMIPNNAALAMRRFNDILRLQPKSPRAHYGKAMCFDAMADQKRSNQLLLEAVANYMEVLMLPKVPPYLFLIAGDRCIQRLRFIGHYAKAIKVHKLMTEQFHQNVTAHNQLVVTYLLSNRISEARELLRDVLKKWPNDGFALAHYGFILKVHDHKLNLGAKYLQKALETKAEGVIDGRFYFHLGDALFRLGRREEATEVYKDGVKHNLFLSTYQRSLYNVNGLTGKPWWYKSDTPGYQRFYGLIEKNYKGIRDEALAVLNHTGLFHDEAENLRQSGAWQQYELYARGHKNVENCKKCPLTCKILETLPDATGCKRGQIKFSILYPGTHVWPHCGPTNCRLRVHLGLVVPPETYIRVGDVTRSWSEGSLLIFDDSFEHEVWNNSTQMRLVLIVDVWHPDLTNNQKRSLSAI